MSACTLEQLEDRLGSEDAAMVLVTAWDAFRMTTEVCDRIAFDEGNDELQAMVAAQKCAEARDLLPLPETGRPVTLSPPGPGTDHLVPYVRLLEHVSGALSGLRGDEAGLHVLARAAELASGAAAALARVREG
ncbi:hypothetical protein ACFWBH_01040 [Streptomyces sp. NPDC059999]|uniref:hypothetical protein n=1 Tax=Streptomyces sp. NPDC059999 TaxID=3347030 RepID=UPI0036B360FD